MSDSSLWKIHFPRGLDRSPLTSPRCPPGSIPEVPRDYYKTWYWISPKFFFGTRFGGPRRFLWILVSHSTIYKNSTKFILVSRPLIPTPEQPRQTRTRERVFAVFTKIFFCGRTSGPKPGLDFQNFYPGSVLENESLIKIYKNSFFISQLLGWPGPTCHYMVIPVCGPVWDRLGKRLKLSDFFLPLVCDVGDESF